MALCGPSGFGKTSTAVNLAYCASESGFHVFWACGSADQTLKSSLQEAARKIPAAGRNGEGEDWRLVGLKDWLDSLASGKWLLIVDGVNDLESISERTLRFIPQLKGTVLFTTQERRILSHGRYGVSPEDFHEMPEMEDDEAMCAFLHAIGRAEQGELAEEERKGIESLLQLLGNLPLAIAQVAARVQESKSIIPHFTQLFINNLDYQREILAKGIPTATEYESKASRAVKTAWDSTFEKISADSMKILEVMSFLDSNDISLALFKGSTIIKPVGSLEFFDARDSLINLGLINPLEGDMRFRLHPMISLRIREYMKEEIRRDKLSTATFTLSRKFPTDHNCSYEEASRLVPHCRRVLEHSKTYKSKNSDYTVQLLHNLGRTCLRVLRADNRYSSQAIRYLRESIELDEQLNGKDNHSKTSIESFALIARNYRDNLIGFKEARSFFEKALAIAERLSVKDDIVALALSAELEQVLNFTEEREGAQVLRTALLEKAKSLAGRVGDPIERVFLAVLRASYREEVGEGKEEDLDRALVSLREHMDSGISLKEIDRMWQTGLVDMLLYIDRLEEGLEVYTKCTEFLEKKLGPDHPDTLAATFGKAHFLAQMGNYEQAMELFQGVIDGEEKDLKSAGMDYTKNFKVMHCIGCTLARSGKLEEALDFYGKELGENVKAHLSEHSVSPVLTCKENMYPNKGDRDNALRWLLGGTVALTCFTGKWRGEGEVLAE